MTFNDSAEKTLTVLASPAVTRHLFRILALRNWMDRQADRKVSAYLDLKARFNDITRMAFICLFVKFIRNRLIVAVHALT